MRKLLILLSAFVILSCSQSKHEKPRVFVFTDINIDQGDPDDRQSLIHLFWYADEVNIEGIVPDRWNAQGYEACDLALQAFEKDYAAINLSKKGYPDPVKLRSKIAKDMDHAVELFKGVASNRSQPLYVLIWGNMRSFVKAINFHPEYADNIRLITIGTHLMMEAHRPHLPEAWEKTEKPCEQYNWNGFGRNEFYNDERFVDTWWLEINWTYEGMFTGDEPKEMFEKLSQFGALGQHMKDVVKNQEWAKYFRVGDTPSVLYVIDPNHSFDDPTQPSWAGRFKQPFPKKRPNYFTDDNGPVEWNYVDPCETWENHIDMNAHAKSTLEEERPEMYEALLEKLDNMYK